VNFSDFPSLFSDSPLSMVKILGLVSVPPFSAVLRGVFVYLIVPPFLRMHSEVDYFATSGLYLRYWILTTGGAALLSFPFFFSPLTFSPYGMIEHWAPAALAA